MPSTPQGEAGGTEPSLWYMERFQRENAVASLRTAVAVIVIISTVTGTALGDERCSYQILDACSDVELMDLLTARQLNRFFPDVDPEAAKEAIVRKVSLPALLKQIETTDDSYGRDKLIDIAFHRSEPEVARVFESMLGLGVEEGDCLIAHYLAKRGNRRALEVLNKHYGEYRLSSYGWSYVIPVFGIQRFYPATENLLASLDAASLNVVIAAEEALKRLYPGAPETFQTLEEVKAYWRKRIKEVPTQGR
jgi:hypothetical protein